MKIQGLTIEEGTNIPNIFKYEQNKNETQIIWNFIFLNSFDKYIEVHNVLYCLFRSNYFTYISIF